MPFSDFERFTEPNMLIKQAMDKLDTFPEKDKGLGIAYQYGCYVKGWLKSKGFNPEIKLYEPEKDGNPLFINFRFDFVNKGVDFSLENQPFDNTGVNREE